MAVDRNHIIGVLHVQHEPVFGSPWRRDDRSVHHGHHLLVGRRGQRYAEPVVDRAEPGRHDAFDRREELHGAAQILSGRVGIVQAVRAAGGFHLRPEQRVLGDGGHRGAFFRRERVGCLHVVARDRVAPGHDQRDIFAVYLHVAEFLLERVETHDVLDEPIVRDFLPG